MIILVLSVIPSDNTVTHYMLCLLYHFDKQYKYSQFFLVHTERGEINIRHPKHHLLLVFFENYIFCNDFRNQKLSPKRIRFLLIFLNCKPIIDSDFWAKILKFPFF